MRDGAVALDEHKQENRSVAQANNNWSLDQ